MTTWQKRHLAPGTDWQRELDHHLNTAALILLLVSSDFLASDYCYGIEMQRALQRHEANEVRVIPLLLRPVDWQQTPFGKLTVLPRNEKPITAWRNRDAAFTDIVQGIKAVLERLQHLPPVSPSGGVWNVPYRRNPYFTGRDDLLERLTQQFAPEESEQGTSIRQAALTQPQAIKGLGGIGKTQIAVEYAYSSRELGRYTHTLWVNARNAEAIIASFVMIAELLPNFAAKHEEDQQKLAQAVKRWLEQCEQRWLLIFDNADDLTLIQEYLPQIGQGSVLLTTRASAVGSLAASLEVGKMSPMEGVQLLLHRTQRSESASDEAVNEAINIVIALDYFPLALDQAGAYIGETRCSLVDYLQSYQLHRRALHERRGTQMTHYPDTVATTWSLSFQKVEVANPAAAEFLRLCAFLAPDAIPEELIKEGAAYWSPPLQQAVADPSLDHRLPGPQQRGRPTSRFRFRAWQTNSHRDPSTFFKNSEITRCDLFPKLFFLSCQNPVTTLKIAYDNLSKKATVINPVSNRMCFTKKSDHGFFHWDDKRSDRTGWRISGAADLEAAGRRP